MNLVSVIGHLAVEVPLIALCAVFAIIGWQKLRHQHRRAGTWLVVGMLSLATRSMLGAVSLARAAAMSAQVAEGSLSQGDFGFVLAAQGLISYALLLLSITCLGMSALSGRSPRLPGAGAT